MTNTRIAVFGASGMLGRHVIKAIKQRDLDLEAIPIYRQMTDVLDKRNIIRLLDEYNAETVINCVGVIPQRNQNPLDMIRVNSMFPHVLSGCFRPVIHVSTDCVFSGRNRYRYKIQDIPDPRDYYGKSKALGEVIQGNVINVRTSFVGCDHGLMNWLFSVSNSTTEKKKIYGYKNALWTGSTVDAAAQGLVEIALDPTSQENICHLSTNLVVNKYDLILKIIERYDLKIEEVEPSYYPTVNRALIPTKELPDIDLALANYKCARTQEAVA